MTPRACRARLNKSIPTTQPASPRARRRHKATPHRRPRTPVHRGAGTGIGTACLLARRHQPARSRITKRHDGPHDPRRERSTLPPALPRHPRPGPSTPPRRLARGGASAWSAASSSSLSICATRLTMPRGPEKRSGALLMLCLLLRRWRSCLGWKWGVGGCVGGIGGRGRQPVVNVDGDDEVDDVVEAAEGAGGFAAVGWRGRGLLLPGFRLRVLWWWVDGRCCLSGA